MVVVPCDMFENFLELDSTMRPVRIVVAVVAVVVVVVACNHSCSTRAESSDGRVVLLVPWTMRIVVVVAAD